MYRTAIERLYKWKESKRRKPLIIEGAPAHKEKGCQACPLCSPSFIPFLFISIIIKIYAMQPSVPPPAHSCSTISSASLIFLIQRSMSAYS